MQIHLNLTKETKINLGVISPLFKSAIGFCMLPKRRAIEHDVSSSIAIQASEAITRLNKLT